MSSKALDSLAQEVPLRRNKVMTSTYKECARLTVALRAFGGLSSDISREPTFIDELLIRRKRTKKADSASDDKAWAKLRDDVTSQCAKPDISKVAGC